MPGEAGRQGLLFQGVPGIQDRDQVERGLVEVMVMRIMEIGQRGRVKRAFLQARPQLDR